MASPTVNPARLLVVLPSWVGDFVMATPALRLLRTALPGSLIGVLARTTIDELLADSDLFDQIHLDRPHGMMGPKRVASRIRPQRYDTALLLTNSFSTALTTRLAFIPRRIGYDRDRRGFLLSQKLTPERRADGAFEIVPACEYYYRAARALLEGTDRGPIGLPPDARMELTISRPQHAAAESILVRAGIGSDQRVAILNPGGNKPGKRWPADRFAALADHLAERHGLKVLINGSPAEASLTAHVAATARTTAIALPPFGVTLGSLKALIKHASIVVSNDTGPRHIAAALGTPVVTLFGPTDSRWTTIPAPAGEEVLVADATLGPLESADDHPERCRIDRIDLSAVTAAADRLLERTSKPAPPRKRKRRSTGRV